MTEFVYDNFLVLMGVATCCVLVGAFGLVWAAHHYGPVVWSDQRRANRALRKLQGPRVLP